MRHEAPDLHVEELSFAYDRRPVLHGLSLHISGGDFVGLIGPNGAGKTTLIRLLAGILAPAAGRVRLGGTDLRDFSRRETARRIGFVPQAASTAFPLRTREAVALGRYPHRGAFAFETADDMAAVHAAMESTETLAFADRFAHALSAGERQRVLLARALAQDPEILLLDEPTSHLDLHHQARFLDLIDATRQAGRRTVVFVSHDVNLIAHRARRLVLLKEGRLAADGLPAEVLTAKRLTEVFETELRLVPDPKTGIPFVFPEPRSLEHEPESHRRFSQ